MGHVQVGGGRTVSEVAAELSCDWHTVNDAVLTYGEALLEADRKRMNRTSAIGLDETSFVRLGTGSEEFVLPIRSTIRSIRNRHRDGRTHSEVASPASEASLSRV